jgi:hypothetical protein
MNKKIITILAIFSCSLLFVLCSKHSSNPTGPTGGYTLTATAYPSAGGKVSLSPTGGTYDSGTVVTVTAVPSTGYIFSNWTNGSGSVTGTNATTQIIMTGNESITANFLSSASLTTYTLTVTSNPSAGGTVTLSPAGGTYDSGTVVTLTEVPSSGYIFSSWGWNASGTGTTTQVTMTANLSVEANFSAPSVPPTCYMLTVTPNPSAGGTVTLSPAGGTYTPGTVVTLTATPSSGYNFSNWSENASGTNATTQITMTGNMNVMANFSAVVTSVGTVVFNLTNPCADVVTIMLIPQGESDTVYGYTAFNGTNAYTSLSNVAIFKNVITGIYDLSIDINSNVNVFPVEVATIAAGTNIITLTRTSGTCGGTENWNLSYP